MIARERHREALRQLLANNPVVALGARQIGKTTLARDLAERRAGPTHFFDLESSADRARLADPLLALAPLRGSYSTRFNGCRMSSPLDSVDVIDAGADTFPLARRIRAVAAARMLDDV